MKNKFFRKFLQNIFCFTFHVFHEKIKIFLISYLSHEWVLTFYKYHCFSMTILMNQTWIWNTKAFLFWKFEFFKSNIHTAITNATLQISHYMIFIAVNWLPGCTRERSMKPQMKNSTSRLFSTKKWNYCFQLARRIFFALLLLRLKLFLADFNSTTWMPTCFNWLNMIYHLAECKAFVMQRMQWKATQWLAFTQRERMSFLFGHHPSHVPSQRRFVNDYISWIGHIRNQFKGFNMPCNTARPVSVFDALLAMPCCSLSSIAPSRSSSRSFSWKVAK